VHEDIVAAWLALGGAWPAELEPPLPAPDGPPPGLEPPAG